MGCVPFQRWMKPADAPEQPEVAVPALRIDGEVTTADAATVQVWLLTLGDEELATLDLNEADISEGAAMAALTRALADRLDGGGALHLDGPPQLLLHNLYRVGRHPHLKLSTSHERNEEAYG
jgi:hypothetical protein